MSFVKSRIQTKIVHKMSVHSSDCDIAETFTMCSFNVQFDEKDHISKRTDIIIDLIKAADPDVILLQEVCMDTDAQFERGLSDYVRAGQPHEHMHYYTATYLKKGICIISQGRSDFSGLGRGQMGRDMHLVTARILNTPVLFVNTHLESLKDNGAVRIAQLQEILLEMLGVTSGFEGPAVCAGDLNMRDAEQKAAFENARKISCSNTVPFEDAYVFFGKPKECYKTWRPNDKPTWGCRFDRCYHNRRGIDFVPVTAEQPLQLLGNKPAPGLFCTGEDGNQYPVYPSDHRGLLIRFHLKSGASSPGASMGTSTSSKKRPSTSSKSGREGCDGASGGRAKKRPSAVPLSSPPSITSHGAKSPITSTEPLPLTREERARVIAAQYDTLMNREVSEPVREPAPRPPYPSPPTQPLSASPGKPPLQLPAAPDGSAKSAPTQFVDLTRD